MKLIVRRKVAVPFSVPPREVVSGRECPKLRDYIWDACAGLLQCMSNDARKDGLESGDVLVEVTDEGSK